MDPVTHAVIGLGISTFSSQTVSLDNPLTLGCMIGAVAPDLDIITRYKGDYHYIKHHRGFTHSIIGLGIISGIIAFILSFIFKEHLFKDIFLWTLLGSLSHSFFDYLNSYGVRFLLPVSNKRFSASLLMLYDPIIIVLCMGLIFIKGSSITKIFISLIITVTYLGIRMILKIKSRNHLENHYKKQYIIKKINVLPSLMNPIKWDFIIETESYNIVGQINSLTKKINIRKKLRKINHELISYIDTTILGKYFFEFTPIRHFYIEENNESIIFQIIDLRYFLKNDFMHRATIVFNTKKEVVSQIFHPYSVENRIIISEKNKKVVA